MAGTFSLSEPTIDPPIAPQLPLCRLFSDTYKISEIRRFLKPFCRQFMHFSAIFGMLAVLATSVTPWYPV